MSSSRSRKSNGNSSLVYSTETGRVRATPKPPPSTATADGVVRISREKKGRKGAGVSLVVGLPLTGDDLKALAKQLKQVCGTGGTVKDGVIEIQGDHRELLRTTLVDAGYTVKLSGG